MKDLMVVAASDGIEVERVPAPKPLTNARARLRALQRRAARQQGPWDQESETRRDPSRRWCRTQARVANLRRDELHKATTRVVCEHEVVVVEDLNVAGMSRSGGTRKRGLNRAIADAGLGSLRTMLGYKATWNQTRLVTAGRWFPSTRTCSRCQAKTKLSLRDRVYRCRNGCPDIDRDLNAATNLARLGDTTIGGGTGTGTGSGPAVSVTAGDGRGANHKTRPTTPVGKAGGDEASTPHGDRPPQGEAA